MKQFRNSIVVRFTSIFLIFSLILVSCGSVVEENNASESSAENTSASNSIAAEEESPGTSDSEKGEEVSSDPLRFETDGGILEYESYEYVSNGFYSDDSGDPSLTLVINFTYTNKGTAAKNYSSDFYITAFQNGIELKGPSSFSYEGAPESYRNAYENVSKDGTIIIGTIFTLQDYSPLTIVVKQNGGFDESAPMLLEIDPYEDNSFNLDLLFGLWEDQKSGKELTLTSAEIWFGKDGSGSSMQEPKLWTDKDTLHTGFSTIGNLQIDQTNDSLHMFNDQYDFIQLENWSEEDSKSSDPQSIQLNESIPLDFAEITFKQYDVQNEIEASSMLVTSSGGTGGNISKKLILESAQDGKKYLLIQGTVKNLSSTSINPKNMIAKLIINDTAELDCKISVVDESATSLNSIEPLNSANIIIDAAVSEDMISGITKAEWLLGFSEHFSRANTTDLSSNKYYYCLQTVGDDETENQELSADESESPEIEQEQVKEVERHHQKEYTKLEYNNIDTVKIIQNALNEQSYPCGDADGSIGNATISAIKNFQKDHGLDETGIIDDELIDILGCWDETDLKFMFNFCDQDGTPLDSFKRADRVYIQLFFADTSRARNIRYTFKTIGPDGFILYNEMSNVYDKEGNPGFVGFVYFNTPDIAPTGTMKCEVTDDTGTLLAKTSIKVK